MAGSKTEKERVSYGLQVRDREDLNGGDRELLRAKWKKEVQGRKKRKAQQHGKKMGSGRGRDAQEGRRGPEGPGLTAAFALDAAGRMYQFGFFFLLLSSLPLLLTPVAWLSST